MDTMESPKLKMAEILKDAWKLYKENAGLFLKIIFLIVLLIFIFQIGNAFLLKITTGGMFADFILGLIVLIFYILFIAFTIYFYFRLFISLYAVIAARSEGYDISFQCALIVGSKRFGGYILAYLKLFLILFLPLTGFFVTVVMDIEPLTKFMIGFAFFIPYVYLLTIYHFAPIIAVLDKGLKPHLKMSRKLVKGNWWRVMALTFGLVVLSILPCIIYEMVFYDSLVSSSIHRYTAYVLYYLLEMLLSPFINSVLIITYNRLKQMKGYIPAKPVSLPEGGVI